MLDLSTPSCCQSPWQAWHRRHPRTRAGAAPPSQARQRSRVQRAPGIWRGDCRAGQTEWLLHFGFHCQWQEDWAYGIPFVVTAMSKVGLWISDALVAVLTAAVYSYYKSFDQILFFWASFISSPRVPPGLRMLFGIKITLEDADDVHIRGSHLLFQPGGGLFADAVMVAHGCAAFQNGLQDTVLQVEIFLNFVNPGNEDPVEIGSLGVGMGEVGHANGVGASS